MPVGATSKNAMVPMTTVNTKNILFICGGAFPDLEKIIKTRLTKTSSIGFGADLKDKKILLIDDICSYGGTFKHSLEKLKEMGAGECNIYVTHCENSVLKGDLINSKLFKKIYTTNSIFTKENEKIEVFKLWS